MFKKISGSNSCGDMQAETGGTDRVCYTCKNNAKMFNLFSNYKIIHNFHCYSQSFIKFDIPNVILKNIGLSYCYGNLVIYLFVCTANKFV